MPNDPRRAAVAANHAVWETWTPHHFEAQGYDIPSFKAGREPLHTSVGPLGTLIGLL